MSSQLIDPNTPQPLQLNDTPTHRLHMMQMSMQEIAKFIEHLRIRRASIEEKIKKAKANSKLARSLQTDKQFRRLVDKMERQLAAIEADINDIADDLNKARALFLEMSDGEVLLEKEVIPDGDAKVECD